MQKPAAKPALMNYCGWLMLDVLAIAKALIANPSITPDDAGCQALLIEKLSALGFEITPLPFGKVQNFWAQYGKTKPLLIFAGHTDVVPTGPLEQWNTPPFEPTIVDGYLYGRGAADMKASLAAMLVASEQFLVKHRKQLQGSIGFLITSDEEGPATDGTVKVVEWLKEQGIIPDYCIVGEPSSSTLLGDTIKNGRRGSLNGQVTFLGKQGHIAYPHLATNTIHHALPVLEKLTQEVWDEGNDFFPATSLQLSNIQAGTGTTNVIPGTLEARFNFRYSTEVNANRLKQRTATILDTANMPYELTWQHSGKPFLTSPDTLTQAAQQAIKDILDTEARLSTSGGTSDGRFIATLGCQLIELGPCNDTIHQINERVNVADIDKLAQVYMKILALVFKI